MRNVVAREGEWPDSLDLFDKGILALGHFHDLRSQLRKVLLKIKSNKRLINVRLAATTYSRFVPMLSLFTTRMVKDLHN